MPTIKKATIKSYSAATHKATVQIAGSLGVWLDAIRVATDIPAADVVAGRQCTVLFLDPANQDDAVVLTIQGALPSGGGGGTTDHGALTGLGDDDHPQYGALAQAETWAALQTFSAGLQLAASQAIKDSGSTPRISLATASPHVTLAGDIRLGDHAGVGADPLANTGLLVSYDAALASGTHSMLRVEPQSSLTVGGNNVFVRGVFGAPFAGIDTGPYTGIAFDGLWYVPGISGGGAGTVVGRIRAVAAQPAVAGFTGTVTLVIGLGALAPIYQSLPAGTVITTSIGAQIGNYGANAKVVDVIGLEIADTTLNTGFTRLLELGGTLGTLPNLRLEGRAPTNPGAGLGRSQLLLSFNENGTVTLRRVEWKNPDATGHMAAADKVLVAV
ncbi:MAG: hypothetical protein Q8Q00_06940 [Dehalococcoidia bacterium]|nr:hypothetical protein [Dehalococcoidia bacterium]